MVLDLGWMQEKRPEKPVEVKLSLAEQLRTDCAISLAMLKQYATFLRNDRYMSMNDVRKEVIKVADVCVAKYEFGAKFINDVDVMLVKMTMATPLDKIKHSISTMSGQNMDVVNNFFGKLHKDGIGENMDHRFRGIFD